MVLLVLGSSSRGNCYILAGNSESLVIEAGIKMSEVKNALRFYIANIRACVVSHEHKDHSKYVKDFLKCGIRVLALQQVFQSQDIASPFCKTIEPLHGYKAGGFRILALPVEHDVPCVGFIIEHPEMGKLLFITDTMMLKYKLPADINHVMLEANYADEILQYNIDNGITAPAMRARLLNTHMELQTTKGILTSNDISHANEVILIHLSGDNSNALQFKREVEECTGKPVYVAVPGMKLNVDKQPY